MCKQHLYDSMLCSVNGLVFHQKFGSRSSSQYHNFEEYTYSIIQFFVLVTGVDEILIVFAVVLERKRTVDVVVGVTGRSVNPSLLAGRK